MTPAGSLSRRDRAAMAHRWAPGDEVEIDVISAYIDNAEPRWRLATVVVRKPAEDGVPVYRVRLVEPLAGFERQTWGMYEDRMRDAAPADRRDDSAARAAGGER